MEWRPGVLTIWDSGSPYDLMAVPIILYHSMSKPATVMFPARILICGWALIACLAQMPFGAQAEVQHPDAESLSPGPRGFEVEQHEGIFIDGDEDFTFDNGVLKGTGTANDPYIISGWDINTNDTIGIRIMNTRSYFVIRDCYIHGNHSRPGIVLGNVTSGRIVSNFICDNNDGISCDDGSGHDGVSFCNFTKNSIVSNKGSGFWFTHILNQHIGNNISSNNISKNECGISAIVFRDNVITDNLISFNKGWGVIIGMCTGGGGGNLICHNSFIQNNNGSKQCVDDGAMEGLSSLWNDSCHGNYWSDLPGPDSNWDGVVDRPYKFNFSACDYYPLVNPVEGIEYRPAPPDYILAGADRKAPMIFDLTPANSSLAGQTLPAISANFSDGSGIDLLTSSLVLDGIDITRNATWTCGSVRFEPNEPMSGKVHTVELSLTDNSTRRNHVYVSWSFTVPDNTPPRVFDLQPADQSSIRDTRPTVSANFSDESGIYPPGVFLYIDSMDVTGHAWYTTGHIVYRPIEPLATGVHRIRLALADGSVENNLAIALWNFTVEVIPVQAVDQTPLAISRLRPDDSSRTNDTRPVVAANYTDDSGIDVPNITLVLDGKDVTRNSTFTPGGIAYHPPEPLAPGEHFVSLRVADLSTERNTASVHWNFIVLAQEPGTPSIIDKPGMDRSVSSTSTFVGFAMGFALAIILFINYKRK
jgi:hypothetical protein